MVSYEGRLHPQPEQPTVLILIVMDNGLLQSEFWKGHGEV